MARIPAPARIPLARRLALRVARSMFGQTPEPFAVNAHHRGVFWATLLHESLLQRSRRRLPAELYDLVTHRVATLVGCPWCIDFGAMLALRGGLTPERILAVDDYRTSELFNAVERRALEFADAATVATAGSRSPAPVASCTATGTSSLARPRICAQRPRAPLTMPGARM